MEYQTVKDEKVPSLGLGTYRLTGDACEVAVERALGMGYRNVDTAQMYGNEAEVGRGIEDSSVDRGEIFLTTKVWPSDFAHDRVISKTRESLKKLRTDYVDLLLMHWPGDSVPLGETLGAMRELQDEGSVLHIGVSNFSRSLAEEATEHAEIFCNQVQMRTARRRRRWPCAGSCSRRRSRPSPRRQASSTSPKTSTCSTSSSPGRRWIASSP